jgi:hypothetical protein
LIGRQTLFDRFGEEGSKMIKNDPSCEQGRHSDLEKLNPINQQGRDTDLEVGVKGDPS